MRQLPGHLRRRRAVWLRVGRPAVLIPAAVVVAIMASPDGWVRPDVVLLLVVVAVVWYLATRGTRVTPRRHPDLAALVAVTAAALGNPVPRRVGLVRAPVVRVRVFAGRRELLIGAPLAARLSRDELVALVAHELSVLARPSFEIILYDLWVRAITRVDPGRYATRVVRELDEFSAAVEQDADATAGRLTDPTTAARAAARAWLIATAPVADGGSGGALVERAVDWTPTLALRLSRRHPDLTEALLALAGTRLSTAPAGRALTATSA